MNNEEFNDKTPYASIIATAIIQAILIAIKLSGIVDWPWWIILLPAELTIGATALVFIIIAAVFVVEMYKDYRKQKKIK